MTAGYLGARTVALTGARRSTVAAVSDLVLAVPSEDTVRIQEAHITIGHIICDLVEKHFAGDA
jgi:D-sedoheptulose 7-phosphate isomerase